MKISESDSEKMCRLAQEGKPISKIASEYFPYLDYCDIYLEVYSSGERSSIGIKRMITNRLNTMVESRSKKDRTEIAEEVQDLVWHLYENHKLNRDKLANIREVLGE